MGMSSGKITVFVIAAHHLSDNIASQRFKALTRYLDADLYDVHVFCKTRGVGGEVFKEHPGVTVHAVPGTCVGSGAGFLASLFVIASSAFRQLPFLIRPRGVWLTNVVQAVSKLVEKSSLGIGESITVASYSPIDSLIAARSIEARHGLKSVLDFRDGFVFESLGRKGVSFSCLRRWVESRVVVGAAIVVTVSRPLVEDFRCRYPSQRVELLPNGFDPIDSAPLSDSRSLPQVTAILKGFPRGKFVIGHFGRIGASDASRIFALQYFIDCLNASPHRDDIHVVFVGTLLAQEKAILHALSSTCTLVEQVERNAAQRLMQESDALLLITGKGVGCVTGKVFEYLVAGPSIACFSMVRNEAAFVLDETGCGRTILVGDRSSAAKFFSDLVGGQLVKKRNANAIARYSRVEQATMLSLWIQSECIVDANYLARCSSAA